MIDKKQHLSTSGESADRVRSPRRLVDSASERNQETGKKQWEAPKPTEHQSEARELMHHAIMKDLITRATEDINSSRLHAVIKNDLMIWDRFQASWQQTLERQKQPSELVKRAAPQRDLVELKEWTASIYEQAYQSDDGTEAAFIKCGKAAQMFENALKSNNPNHQYLLDRTSITRTELEHAGLVLGRSQRRANEGASISQEYMLMLQKAFDRSKQAYEKTLQVRSVREGSEEAISSKWLRIGKEGARNDKDIKDMFWHDARWAIRNKFLASNIANNKIQEADQKLLEDMRQLPDKLKRIYDTAKN